MAIRPSIIKFIKQFTNAAFIFCLLSIFYSTYVYSADRYAASCSKIDVNNAIIAANPGDTVRIPSGTCTWNSGISVIKSLNIIGSGIDNTVIIDSTSTAWASSNVPFWFGEGQNGKRWRISNMTFKDSGLYDPNGVLIIRGTNHIFRFDHIKFYNLRSRSISIAGDNIYGVIDHCEFIKPSDISGSSIIIDPNNADAEWSKSSIGWGDNNAVYIENSRWDYSLNQFDGTFDCQSGGKVVFRFNNVRGTVSGNHGADSVARGCLRMEVYNNNFDRGTASVNGPPWALRMRGGSAVVFNNTFSGTFDSGEMLLTHYRSCCDRGALCEPPHANTCDGYQSVDGNTDPRSTYKGWPCLDQPGVGVKQHLEPIYEWNNQGKHFQLFELCSVSSGSLDVNVATHVKLGRDYINNTARPSYIPYSYPHPLTTYDFVGATGVSRYPQYPIPIISTP